MSTYPISRLNYYNGELLKVIDFHIEQNFHIGHREQHLRLLHVAGIVEGLHVKNGVSSDTIEVTSGVAVDRNGRQLFLDATSNLTNGRLPAAAGGTRSQAPDSEACDPGPRGCQ
jgi:hypothetical protein